MDTRESIETNSRHPRLAVDQRAMAAFCRKNHIRKLSFFGSILRNDFGPDSDVDVLVEFEPGHVPGLAFFAMETELSAILGRTVDLSTPQFLGAHFRRQVLNEAEVAHAQA